MLKRKAKAWRNGLERDRARLDWIGGSGLTFTQWFPPFPWKFQETPALIGTAAVLKVSRCQTSAPTSFLSRFEQMLYLD